MKLLIYAHPKTKGNGYAILEEIKKQIGKCEVLDLYAMKYDPVLHDDELYTVGHKKISKTNLAIQKKIAKADGLVFIYPVWWGTMPAILKGFFDKVLTAPFAFEYAKLPVISHFIGYVPVGNLGKKRAVVFTTTGAKRWQSEIFQGMRFGSIIKKDILEFCGIDTKVFQLAGCGKWDEKRRPEVKRMVAKGLKFLQ